MPVLSLAYSPLLAHVKHGVCAIKAKFCEDVAELVSFVQQVERNRHNELEQLQENTIRSNFMPPVYRRRNSRDTR